MINRLLSCFILSLLSSASLIASEQREGDKPSVPQFSVIGRLDVAPSISSKSNNAFSWGNSGLYSELSGEIGRHFSYFLCNHWLCETPSELYKKSFYSSASYWLDFATLTYVNKNWEVSVGKDLIPFGTFEQDGDDYSAHPSICSIFWNTAALYHWGAKASYSLSSGTGTFTIGLSDSPYNGMPFDNGLLTYSVAFRGNLGGFSCIWSANLMQSGKSQHVSVLALGNRVDYGHFYAYLDLVNSAIIENPGYFNQELSITGCLGYRLSNKIELMAKGGYERNNAVCGIIISGNNGEVEYDIPYGYGGVAVNFYPFEKYPLMRFHAVVSANNYFPGISVLAGILLHLNINTVFSK